MGNIFTNYPQTSEGPLEEVKVSKIKADKLIKAINKIQRELKKQKKIIQKLSEQKEESERTSSKCNTKKKPTQDKEKNFWGRVKDKFIDAVPSICRTAVKAMITLAFGRAFKHFGLLKAA